MRSILQMTTLLVALAAFASGCLHYTTQIPGVLDLRSDGADVPRELSSLKDSKTARTGVEAFFLGAGVENKDKAATVEDRSYWIISLFPIINTSAAEEIAALQGDKGGSLADVVVGEQSDLFDIFVPICVSGIPLVNLTRLVMPPLTFKASAVRLQSTSTDAPQRLPETP